MANERLVITSDDLAAPPTAGASPGSLPPVGGTYPVAAQPPGAYMLASRKKKLADMTPGEMLDQVGNQSTVVSSVIAAAVAILPAWVLSEVIASPSANDGGSLVGRTALWTGVIGAAFCAIYGAWDEITGQLWEAAGRAALIGAVVGAIAGAASGALAQVLFTAILKHVLARAVVDGSFPTFEVRLAYAAGWAVFGVGAGVACGAVRRSSRKLVNATIGGVLGGALGGFAFSYIAEWLSSSQGLARLLSLLIIGVAIGVAVGLVEVARRQAWVKIVGGGMAGKEFILYHQATVFGRSPKCEITLIKDGAVAPMHFRIDEHATGRRALSAFDGCPVTINGVPVAQHWLRAGDIIGVGATALQYAERAVAS